MLCYIKLYHAPSGGPVTHLRVVSLIEPQAISTFNSETLKFELQTEVYETLIILLNLKKL